MSVTWTSSTTKRHTTSRCNARKATKKKKICGFFKKSEQKQTALPRRRRREGGRVGGRERESEGGEVWLDDRMAAFTQRVVSPAETHFFTIQHNRALRSLSPPINIHAGEVSAAPRRLVGFVVFRLWLYFDVTRLGILPCPQRMDRPCQSRRTKRIKPLQRTESRILLLLSVSTRDNHLASLVVFFFFLLLGCLVCV